jgi:hypothetical protein
MKKRAALVFSKSARSLYLFEAADPPRRCRPGSGRRRHPPRTRRPPPRRLPFKQLQVLSLSLSLWVFD